MEQVFSYVISFGASVMMPIIFTVIGLCIGMKFGKALKSGLFVGVGFVGLGIVTALLTDNFQTPLKSIEDIFSLNLSVFDMGWPAAASVAYNTAVGALIIPVCLGINFLMLITKTTRTVNIDLWNYWHFAFIYKPWSTSLPPEPCVGLFCSHHMLYYNSRDGRPYSEQIPILL